MSSQLIFYYLLAVVVGILGGIHIPINGALGSRIQSTLVATFTFYGIAFALIALTCLMTWNREAFIALKSAPRWYFLAGVISVIVVGSSTFLIPRLGAVNLFVIVLSIQLISRTIISHMGWLESPISPITPWKILGGILLIIGALMVVRT